MPLVLLLILILPLKNQAFWTSSGGDFTASKYLGAICALYAVIYLFTGNRIPHYLATRQARWYLFFLLLIFLSFAVMSRTTSTAYNPILGPISLLLLCFILLTVVDSLQRLRWVLLTIVGSVGWASLYVIREWEKNRGWETGSRGEWVVGDSNHFAVSAICGLAIAWYMAQEQGRPAWERWFCRGCLIMALIAVVVGASRGGLLGLLAASLFVALRSRKRLRNAVAVLVVVLGFNVAYPHSPLRRLLHPDVNAKGSETAHRASWEAGLRMVRAHPIAGIGIAAFRSQMLKYAPTWYDDRPFMAHNAYISVGAEMGIPGLVVFLAVLITTYLSLERTHRKKSVPRVITQTAVALQAALLGSSISIFFISAEHHEYLWLIVFLSMCLPPLAARFARKRSKAVEAGERSMELVPVLNQV